MPVGNITTIEVDHLAPRNGSTFLWDKALPGFGVRVTQGGTKSYIYQYRLGEGARFPGALQLVAIGRRGQPKARGTRRSVLRSRSRKARIRLRSVANVAGSRWSSDLIATSSFSPKSISSGTGRIGRAFARCWSLMRCRLSEPSDFRMYADQTSLRSIDAWKTDRRSPGRCMRLCARCSNGR